MNYIAVFGSIVYDGSNTVAANMHILDTGTDQELYAINIDLDVVTDFSSLPTLRAAIVSKTIAWAAGVSVTLNSGNFMFPYDVAVPAGMANAPQAAIANAPADAVTNYNVVTTLLGSLTGAVNTANAKQNDLATKFNSLLAELRTLGLIST